MGQFFSVPLPENVRDLADQGVCPKCIARLLSLTPQEVREYKLPDVENCAACSGILDSLEQIKEAAREAIGRYTFHDIQVEIPYALLSKDNSVVNRLKCSPSCTLKNFVKGKIMVALRKSREGPVLHIGITDKNTFNCELQWPNLYITGRYFKRSRRVSHSRFMPGSPVSSVEGELISRFSGLVECSELRFQSAGREDMDVRMLGSGRPFCITIVNPVPDDKLPAPQTKDVFARGFGERLPKEVTCEYGVSATDLEITWREPDVEPKLVKCYRCVVYCSKTVTPEMLERLSQLKNVDILQRTPCRVAHRREMMDREKKILAFEYQTVSDHFFVLDLKTSSGTYIKEFVNSDFGRTKPCLGDLMSPNEPMECQLLQLDVVYVGE